MWWVLTTPPSPVLLGAPPTLKRHGAPAPINTDTLGCCSWMRYRLHPGLGIPTLMAAFAGNGIHLTLEHLAAACDLVAAPCEA